jgi:nitrate/TMAO reductase-like tetraheme cytochrome c subunit
VVLGIAAAGFVIFFLSTLYYTTSPSFCKSCHNMVPYYDSWKGSKHHSVTCVACHYPPETKAAIWAKIQAFNSVVQYMTQKYSSRPYAQVEDASCLREGCHSQKFLEKEITYKKAIHFNHRFHLGDLKLFGKMRCVSCHSQVVVSNHFEASDTPCFLCHLKGFGESKGSLPVGNCLTCHEVPKKDIELPGLTFNHQNFVGARHVSCEKCHFDVVQGDGHASKQRCYICHNQPDRLAKYGDTALLHDTHVAKRKVDCARCHGDIKHGLKKGRVRFMEYSCQTCHPVSHNAPKEMFLGEGGRGAPSTPSHMYLSRLDCLACHIPPKEANPGLGKDGTTFMASEKACTSCHGNQYRGMLKDWQMTFEGMLRDIEPKLDAARKILEKKAIASAQGGAARKLFEDAKFNIDFVKNGKGVHNPFYASELIQVADRNLDRGFRLLEQAPPSLPTDSPIRGGYCAQLCHAKAGVKLPKETTWEGAKLPHTRHAFDYQLGCTTCHSAETHKEIKISKQNCMACHHSPENTQCARCHSKQSALYTAQNLPVKIRDAKANVKAGKVECVGCHDLSKKQNPENISLTCVQCHDRAYVDMLQGWREETLEALKKTRSALEKANKMRAGAKGEKKEIRETALSLERAQKAYDFVAQAKGVHNPDLSGAILEQAQRDIQKAMERYAPPDKAGGK